MEKYRFFVLLGALFALLVSAPMVREFIPRTTPLMSRGVVTGLFVVMLLSAVFAVGRTRLTTKIAISLAVPVILLEVVRIVFRDAAVDIPAHLFGIAFLGYVVLVIIRFLFVTDRATANTICAAVCVYLLLGVLGALVLSTVAILRPDSFATSLGGGTPVIRFGGEQSTDALYFSFVTLTTLGFGDITPTSPVAKMLVAMEAVVGQLFLAVFIARLVGLHITNSRRGRHKDDER